MVEEAEVPTDKLQDEIDELRERESEAKQREDRERVERRWLDRVAISTAILAVFAAVASLQSGKWADDALLRANDAVFHETIAVDTWAEFQADGIKRLQQDSQATLLAKVGGSPAEVQAAQQDSKRRQDQQSALMQKAQDEEKQRDALREESGRALEHHERFALSVSLFQVAIGLGALAALTKKRAVWAASLVAGVVGLVLFVDGFVVFDTLLQAQAAKEG